MVGLRNAVLLIEVTRPVSSAYSERALPRSAVLAFGKFVLLNIDAAGSLVVSNPIPRNGT